MRTRMAATRTRGFTLVELVMVMAVVAVIAAMAAPRWGRSMAHWQVDAAARRLAADLAWAQSRARITSSHPSVNVNVTTGHYPLVGVADPDHLSNTYTVTLGQSPYRSTIVSAAATDANGNIIFDGYGNPATSGTIVLQCGDFQKTVQVNANTGSIGLQ